ncbi:MAG TPA: VWA domain-containing protein [Luteimonas sp.]|nr:VWA domain-containing protein [Luteimonas sp.]
MNFDPAALQALHFLRPHWLWALLALPLLAWWWRARRRQHSVWRDAVDPHLLAHLLEGNAGARVRGALWLGLLGVALAVFALAGPSWQRSEQPLWQSRTPLVIALDLSSAMLANDLPPSRLLQARAKIATLLQQRAGGQVGLVAFADDAYTVAPLADDVDNVALFLDALAPDIMPMYGRPGDGSHADRAIAWSTRLLRQAGFARGDILLLTDHADAAARSAASAAARDGYRVSVLGVGSAGGAAYRDADGRIAQTHLDAGSLRALASAGGGGYATLAAGNGDLVSLGVLDPQQAGAMATHGEKTAIWLDQGYWLLPPLLLLALFAFRRGGALAVLLLCAWLPWQPARAAEREWWLRPDQQAHARLEQGVEAYRKNDFATAQKNWDGLPGADAAYNRGNALAKAGNYDAAIAAYDDALRQQPGMADAIANRRAVEAAKRRKPPSGQKQGNNNQSNQNQGRQGGQGNPQSGQDQGAQTPPQPQSQPQDQPSQDRKPQQPQSSQSPKQDNSGQGAKPDEPADAAAQRAADAAQRERMQRALRQPQQGQSQQEAKATERTETPAERERRLANEAWLRRVPDDPGGLLRARFRLEYERRQQGGN